MTATATHTTMVYDGDRHYATEVGGFLRDGLERGHRALVMAPESRVEAIRRALGGDADEVSFVDHAVAYGPQWNAYRVLLDFAAEAPGVRSCVVAEQPLAARGPAELLDYRRLEAAAGLVFADQPVDLFCPYDARLPGHLLDIALEAHDGVRDNGSVTPNPRVREPLAVLAELAAVARPPSGAATLDCSHHSELALVRGQVRARGADLGLDRGVVADVELAVTEVVTNALVHGSAPVVVHVYDEDGMWVWHVQDGGGLPVAPLAGLLPPAEPADHGYGLWLARQLVAAVDVGCDDTGTHVRLHTRARLAS
ncbi:MAG TPA: MEDS domain-containing protein [Nocardioides sp.]|nr:MEDS domain-containing protein [Nocardioides sp.]